MLQPLHGRDEANQAINREQSPSNPHNQIQYFIVFHCFSLLVHFYMHMWLTGSDQSE